MRNILVSDCNECPFCNNEYDDYSLYDDTFLSCNLVNFSETVVDSTIITSFNAGDAPDNINPPDWCPLSKNKITIEFVK
jgi:hypothetical protein